MDFRKQYLRHCEINDYLESLQSKYSKLVTVATVGYSYENRPIKSIRISNDFQKNPTTPKTVRSANVADRIPISLQRISTCRSKSAAKKAIILIDAGIHAREWCSISTALYCISQLTENSIQNKILLTNFDFVIVPVINADGYEYSRTMKKMWRKTRRPISASVHFGVDCNRNFGIGWHEANNNPSSQTFRGEKAFSEPETKLLKRLMHSLQPKFYLTLHSHAKSIMYPNGFTERLPENWKILQDIASVAQKAILSETGTRFRTGSVAALLKHTASGGSSDYAYNIAKVPFVITMEVSGDTFHPATKSIEGIIRECWIGIRAMCVFLRKQPFVEMSSKLNK